MNTDRASLTRRGRLAGCRVPGVLELFAAGTEDLIASIPLQAALVNRQRRMIGGLAMPWNVFGTPHGAPAGAIFRAGSIDVPEDPTWAKLLIEHDGNRSVGHLAEHSMTAGGMVAAYQLAAGPLADQALDDVENHTRDALSVRVDVYKWSVLPGDVIDVQGSRLRETSLVSVPAYESARVQLAASLPTRERVTIMGELARMLDLAASAPTPGQPAPQPAPQPQPDPAPQPAQVNEPAPQLTAASLAQLLAPALAAAGYRPGEPQAPLPGAPGQGQGIRTIRAAAEAVATWQRDGAGNVMALMAALNDVVPANDAGTGFVGRETWLGELWTATQADRPFVDALGTPRPLTGMKAKGWRWVTRPAVGEYAGNKAVIPSNAVATEPAEANAHRTAGGWDVDRIFVDLGDADMVTALFTAATEDYRRKSNAYVLTQLLLPDNGTDLAAPAASLVGALVTLGGQLGSIGARVSWLAVASDLFGDFAGLTRDQVPWWFGNGATLDPSSGQATVPGFRFWSDPDLAAGTFIGGDQRAATYYETGAPTGVPIKVQALNIANGGVDLGVFGYNAVIVNDARAVVRGSVA